MALVWNQTLTETSTRNISYEVKAAGAYRRQSYCLHVLIKKWVPQPPGKLRACQCLYRDCFQ